VEVAYADFVTAMMAFFLLMWLLGATTKNSARVLPTISPPP
jgi:chemotaxis protein MotB